ncbi:MAG TPA: hypothetical protein VLD65_00210 [Anaerolineales bacterium]|nr:hypothetical protein [Anaerolineales bacterium]
MKLNFRLASGFELQLASGIDETNRYPTARIQKGLVLFHGDQDLSEEAVGFGVPILKRSLQTIFPSEVDLYLHGDSEQPKVSARFKLNLEERITKNGNDSIKNRLIYTSKNGLAAIIRQIPFLRGFLTSTSNLIRSKLDWRTTYEQSDFSTYVVLTYTIDDLNDQIKVELVGGEYLSSSISEIIIMNELGAHHFDQYQDTGGTCQTGEEISCWDPVIAEEAAFIARAHKISFGLHQVQGVRLYRGRELIEPRLAWSGFGYSFPPNHKNVSYTLTIKQLS